MADFFAFIVVSFLCFILGLIFFHVISSFQHVSGWKLRKIARDLSQAQKGNSYLSSMGSRLIKYKGEGWDWRMAKYALEELKALRDDKEKHNYKE